MTSTYHIGPDSIMALSPRITFMWYFDHVDESHDSVFIQYIKGVLRD